MLDSLIYKIQAPFHNLYAIAVYKDEEGSQYQLIEFSYYKNDLKVVFSHKASSLDEVLDKMTKNHPVLLHIEGHDTIRYQGRLGGRGHQLRSLSFDKSTIFLIVCNTT